MNRSRTVLYVFLAMASAIPLVSGQASISAAQYSEQARKALSNGHYTEAEQAYEHLVHLEPGIAEVHANLGLIYFQERKFEQAVPELRTALKLNPRLTKTEALLAMSLSETGRFKDALPGLEKGMRTSSDPQIKRMCGLQLLRAYTGLQKDSEAVRVALELNRLFASDPEVLYHNGKIFGNFAFLSMQKLAEVAPNSVWRYQAAGEAYESEGSYTSAIDEYRQVLALEPQRPGIHYRLGRTLLARSHHLNSPTDSAEAEKEFQQELELEPSNANAAYELGEFRRKAGDFKQAQKFFERALSDHSDFEEAQVALAATLISLDKSQEALPHLQAAIALRADDEAAWYRLSQVQRALGNTAERLKALAEFRRLHEKAARQELGPMTPPLEVTKQEVDPNAAP